MRKELSDRFNSAVTKGSGRNKSPSQQKTNQKTNLNLKGTTKNQTQPRNDYKISPKIKKSENPEKPTKVQIGETKGRKKTNSKII